MIKTKLGKLILVMTVLGTFTVAGLFLGKPQNAQAQSVPAGCVPLPQTITGGVYIKQAGFKTNTYYWCDGAWGSATCTNNYTPTYQGNPTNTYSCSNGSHKWPTINNIYTAWIGDGASFFCVTD